MNLCWKKSFSFSNKTIPVILGKFCLVWWPTVLPGTYILQLSCLLTSVGMLNVFPNFIPENIFIPIAFTARSPFEIDDLLRISCSVIFDKIIYFVSISTNYNQTFSQLHLLSVPVLVRSEYVTAIPEYRHMLRDDDTSTFYALSQPCIRINRVINSKMSPTITFALPCCRLYHPWYCYLLVPHRPSRLQLRRTNFENGSIYFIYLILKSSLFLVLVFLKIVLYVAFFSIPILCALLFFSIWHSQNL